MPVNKDLQNDVPHSCTKPMHQIHAKKWHMPRIRSELQKNSFSKLVFLQGHSICLVVSAAIIAKRFVMQWRPQFLGVIPGSLRTQVALGSEV